MRKLATLTALVFFILLLAAACGDGDGGVTGRNGSPGAALPGVIRLLTSDGVYYHINPDGTGLTRVFEVEEGDLWWHWSADGKKILSVISGEVYVTNADGSGRTRLTNNDASELFPTWSPDGTKIVFVSSRDGHQEIYVMNADGSGVTRLTYTEPDPLRNPYSDIVHASHPKWSPNGDRIAFSVLGPGAGMNHQGLWLMNADGSGKIQLSNKADMGGFAWSPDGDRLAFQCSGSTNCPRGVGNSLPIQELYVINADGSGETRLTYTDTDVAVWGPHWSPDGTRIAFNYYYDDDDDKNNEIYVINADGSGLTNVTNSPAVEGGGDWSPDGKHMVFQSRGSIYIVRSDGSGLSLVTDGPDKGGGWAGTAWLPVP